MSCIFLPYSLTGTKSFISAKRSLNFLDIKGESPGVRSDPLSSGPYRVGLVRSDLIELRFRVIRERSAVRGERHRHNLNQLILIDLINSLVGVYNFLAVLSLFASWD
jgi:hypothetical protein